MVDGGWWWMQIPSRTFDSQQNDDLLSKKRQWELVNRPCVSILPRFWCWMIDY